MSLTDQITTDMKEAMKAKDSATLSTLRMLYSAMKNKQIDLRRELTEEDVTAAIKSQVKQLKDSLQSFTDAGREDLAEGVKAEIVILEKYLPEELTDEQITEKIKEVIEQTGATSKADMGKVMGASMKAVAGQADGTRVKAIAQQLLAVFVLALVASAFAPQTAFASLPMAGSGGEAIMWFEYGARIFRVLILWIGIFSLLSIIKGGFQYATASMRDIEHEEAVAKMTQGIIGTVVVLGLFSAATVFINQIV